MEAVFRTADTFPGLHARVPAAWTAFWNDPAQNRCASGAPEIWQALEGHWSTFAHSLAPGARVLDLGCGAGAVARQLLRACTSISVTGIDFARLPLTIRPRVELLSDTAMESLPFPEHSFDAAVSQFGFEYSDTVRAAKEMARVLAPGAKISFIVHHAGSGVVQASRARLDALRMILSTTTGAAFCAGDVTAFDAQMRALLRQHRGDPLALELARSLPSRLQRTHRERVAIWKAIGEALVPERCISECLASSCVAAPRVGEWLEPLRAVCDLAPVVMLREPSGVPIAWRVEGVRR
ncbi:MAG: class I SAM-dependent methyltransferase [Steroidobacteraceae bacterium]|nr:class I SAM-dependent methyltransferase [Steroidobacteraceae bacterium]